MMYTEVAALDCDKGTKHIRGLEL